MFAAKQEMLVYRMVVALLLAAVDVVGADQFRLWGDDIPEDIVGDLLFPNEAVRHIGPTAQTPVQGGGNHLIKGASAETDCFPT